MAHVGRALSHLARGRREYGPRGALPRVDQLTDLVGAEPEAPPRDVAAQALKAAAALAEPVRSGDDLAPQVVLRLVAQVRAARRLQRQRQVRRIRRVADEVGLELR